MRPELLGGVSAVLGRPLARSSQPNSGCQAKGVRPPGAPLWATLRPEHVRAAVPMAELWRSAILRLATRPAIISNSRAGRLPLFVGVVTYPFWFWYSNQPHIEPDPQFFEISAQVLPVLLLAVIIDVEWSRSLKTYKLIFPISTVFLGEFVALKILISFRRRRG